MTTMINHFFLTWQMIPTFKTLDKGGVGGRENIKRGYLIKKKDFRRLGEILRVPDFASDYFFLLMHIDMVWVSEFHI